MAILAPGSRSASFLPGDLDMRLHFSAVSGLISTVILTFRTSVKTFTVGVFPKLRCIFHFGTSVNGDTPAVRQQEAEHHILRQEVQPVLTPNRV